MAYRDTNVESVGEYEYLKSDLIGHGAFALVYKGHHKVRKDQIVAIKCINKKKVGRAQAVLEKEIKILKELQHKNIVQLYECKESAHSVYLVMEYCNGGDLADYLQSKGSLSEDTIRLFLQQIVAAMAALNSKGIVHRDLKPQNLLLSHKSSKPKPHEITIKIADFGFARYLQGNTMAATLCGSPMYMAPEVITSQHYDAKADLWSVGTILYQCLVGKAPYQASTPQELRNMYERNRRMTPKIPPGTSPELKDLLLRLLQMNIRDRISFREFFNHPFVAMAMKHGKTSSPVPVPTRPSGYDVSPASSNNSDPRTVIPLSPQPGQDVVSPSERDGSLLTMSLASSPLSSKDSEDFVIVSHPLGSSSESYGHEANNNNSGNKNKRHNNPHGHRNIQNTSGRNSPRGVSHTSSSPVLSYGQRRALQTPPPLGSSPNSRRHSQVFGSRKSSLTGGLGGVRFSSSPQEKPKRSDSGNLKPSPSPIPVPTQVENYEKMERKHSTSSCSTASPSNSEVRSRQISTSTDGGSPISFGTSPLTQSPRQDYSPQGGRRGRKLSAVPKTVEFSTIMENPSDEVGNTVAAIKPIAENPPSTGGSNTAMSKAQTVPDLVRYGKLHNENTINRCQSSNKLSEQVMRMLFNNKQQAMFGGSSESAFKPGFGSPFVPLNVQQQLQRTKGIMSSLTPPNSPTDPRDLLKYNENKNLLWTPPSFHQQPSLTQQARQFLATSPPGKRTTFLVGSPEFSSNVDGDEPQTQGLNSTKELVSSTKPRPDYKSNFTNKVEITENVLNFYCKLSDAIDTVAQEHVLPLDTQLISRGFLSRSTAIRQHEAFSSDPLHNVTTEQRQAEQVLLYLRSLQILATALHTIRNKVKAGELELNNNMKQLVMEINNRYKVTCQRCQEARSKCDMTALKQKSFKSADRLLYYYAVHDCRASALDEMFEGSVQQCMTRYRRALVLLEGISLCATDSLDKQQLDKYKSSIDHRLKHLEKLWTPITHSPPKTLS